MSSDNEANKERTFQVVDKRRFDSSGQERSTEITTHTVSSASYLGDESNINSSAEHKKNGSPEFTLKDAPPSNEAEPVAFTSFIMSLATQVLVQLGEMPAPSGMEIPIDFESARQTIDIMAMLQTRTKGNLSAEEMRFMEEVLHSLRLSFVNAKNRTE